MRYKGRFLSFLWGDFYGDRPIIIKWKKLFCLEGHYAFQKLRSQGVNCSPSITYKYKTREENNINNYLHIHWFTATVREFDIFSLPCLKKHNSPPSGRGGVEIYCPANKWVPKYQSTLKKQHKTRRRICLWTNFPFYILNPFYHCYGVTSTLV